MTAAVVKVAPELDAVGLGLLRQRVIVHLLRESSLQPENIAEYVKELIQQTVLTQEVCEEVRALFVEKGLGNLGCRGNDMLVKAKAGDCRVNAIAQHTDVAAPGEGTHPAKGGSPSSRFDQEFDQLELLGRGAFGEVWRARSRVDHKEYAIKKVQYRFNREQGPLAHPALREAQAWADFNHPNAVRYHASWVEVDEEVELKQAGGEAKMTMEPAPVAEDASSTEERRGSTSMSSILSDESSGGIVFEASRAGSSEGGNTQKADAGAFEQEIQLVPRKVAAQVVDRRQRATLYLQTELVRGGTLREWIDKRNAAMAGSEVDATQQQASSKVAEDIFRQIVDAVATLHSQGLVHRDIKPANILLTETGGVRLGDFGLAKDVKSPATAPALEAGADKPNGAGLELAAPMRESAPHTRGVGTPTYASPEQMCDAHYGSEVDIYALGVVLAELLVPVQTQMERADIFEGIRLGRLPPGLDAFSPGAADVVLKMTSLDPKQRPTAHELAALLHQRAVQQALPSTCPQEVGNGLAEARCCDSVCIAPA